MPRKEAYVWETSEELDKKLADRVKRIRKRKQLTQVQLAERSHVSYGSIKRFETTGQISLLSLTKIAHVLGCDDELRQLFADVPYESIEEVLREPRR